MDNTTRKNDRISEIKKRKGMLTRDDIKSAFLNLDDGTSIEYKQLVIAMTMLFSLLIISTVAAFAIFPLNLIYPKLTALLPIGMILIFIFNVSVFKEEEAAISKYAIIVSLMLYVMSLYFRTGGLSGLCSVWIVCVAALTALALRGVMRHVLLVIELVCFWSVHVIGKLHPEYISSYDEHSMNVMAAVSVCEVAAFVAIVVVCQTYIAMDENKKNRRLQDELVASNEELIAQNEEIIATNESLTKVTEQLNDALTSQKLFTASMNHELRAPLNGVLGCMQMLRGAENLTKSQHEVINASFHSANALIHIVNDLLDYAKIEAGEFQIIKKNFDLKEVIDNPPMIMTNMFREKGLALVKEIDPNTPCLLYGDGGRIEQIIANLLSNAAKYTHTGSVTYSVKVVNDTLTIKVADTGEGISEDALAVLFTPFKRLNEGEHKKIQGTGLGLYVTHNLTKIMGGTIEVESKLGVGTTFTVTLPTPVVDAGITYESVREEAKPVGEQDFSNLRLLCVDDSRVNLLMFEKVVGKATRANITVIDSGIKALELLKTSEFDMIFLDHQMPDMDGVETLQNMRKMGIETPTIALTADAGAEKEAFYKEKGFDGFVAKPMKIDEMMRVIAMTFANR